MANITTIEEIRETKYMKDIEKKANERSEAIMEGDMNAINDLQDEISLLRKYDKLNGGGLLD